jgi:hypothetical protein
MPTSKKKKQQLDKRAAKNGTSSSRGHTTLAHTTTHIKLHANGDAQPIKECLVIPNMDPDDDPTLNHPKPHQALWLSSVYLN